MKKLLPLILLVFLLQACTQPPQPAQEGPFATNEKHLLLLHPTVNNIRTIQYLIDEGLFALPPGYRIVGVYNTSAAYDYALSDAYIRDNKLSQVSLYGTEPVDPELVFSNNNLTDVFTWLFQNSEGAIFMGGPDIPPALYTHPTNLLTVIADPHRHYLELSFLHHLLGGYQDPDMIPLLEVDPFYCILGICLGMQSMNVATGGTMYQDIPTELYGATTVEDITSLDDNVQHRNYYANLRTDNQISPYRFHQIMIEPETVIGKMTGGSDFPPFVLSSHHQAVKETGKGLIVTARSMDGKIVEALEHIEYPNVIGIQFHPEPSYLYQKDHKLRFIPGEEPSYSFYDRYTGEKGADFHRTLWKHLGLMYP